MATLESLKPEFRSADCCCLSGEPTHDSDVLCIRSCCLQRVQKAEREEDQEDCDIQFVGSTHSSGVLWAKLESFCSQSQSLQNKCWTCKEQGDAISNPLHLKAIP